MFLFKKKKEEKEELEEGAEEGTTRQATGVNRGRTPCEDWRQSRNYQKPGEGLDRPVLHFGGSVTSPIH